MHEIRRDGWVQFRRVGLDKNWAWMRGPQAWAFGNGHLGQSGNLVLVAFTVLVVVSLSFWLGLAGTGWRFQFIFSECTMLSTLG